MPLNGEQTGQWSTKQQSAFGALSQLSSEDRKRVIAAFQAAEKWWVKPLHVFVIFGFVTLWIYMGATTFDDEPWMIGAAFISSVGYLVGFEGVRQVLGGRR